jgi:hypothetical protein
MLIAQDDNIHTNSAESKPNLFSGYATHRIPAFQATELQSGNSNNEAKQLPSKFKRPMKIRNINSNQARDLGSARVMKPAKKTPSRTRAINQDLAGTMPHMIRSS